MNSSRSISIVDQVQQEIAFDIDSLSRVLNLAKAFYRVPYAYIAIRNDDHTWVSVGDTIKFSAQCPIFLKVVSTGALFIDDHNIAAPILDEMKQVVAVFSLPDFLPRIYCEYEVEMMENFTHQIRAIAKAHRQEVMIQTQNEIIIQNSRLATLGKMSAEIIHEINNPLSIVQARIDLMLIKAKESNLTNETIIDSLTKLHGATDRINQIIKEVKSFSRNVDHDPFEDVSLFEMIEYSLSFCVDRFELLSVKLIKSEIPKSINIRCRLVQISQVIINLINNSLDAIGKKSDAWVEIRVETVGNHILIKVIDSGVGIEAQVLENLFQPFFTTKDKNQGTGLGLSISKNIIESHLGTLEYQLQDAHTCFVVKLPKI